MHEVFTKLLNMSLMAGILVLAVVLLRILLKHAPKKIVCILWVLVAFRLICPFAISSSLSVFNLLNIGTSTNSYTGYFHYNENTEKSLLTFQVPALVNDNISPESMTVGTRDTGLYFPTVMYIWVFGALIMLAYALTSYIALRKEVSASISQKDNVYVCDDIKSPFILGIIRPRIYLPSGIEENVLNHVIAHEKAHLKRLDYLWKPLGFFLLCLYWFNPILWLAYILFCRDIEAACDQRVIEKLDKDSKVNYSEALLACAMQRKMITVCPLAFGETNVKGRVKSIINYKKPAFWIVVVAIAACVIASVCLLTNPKQDSYTIKIVIPANSQKQFYYSEEQISPKGTKLTLIAGEGFKDTEVVLKTVQVQYETAYEPFLMTSNEPVKVEAEKNGWFRIGVAMQNPTENDIEVYIKVENVTVRIADAAETPSTKVLQATVTEIENGSMLATPIEGSWELNSSDVFRIPVRNIESSAEPQVGDIIEILYSGGILEIYPAELENIIQIRVKEHVKENSDVIKCVMVNGELYYYTGNKSSVSARCGNMDGIIDSECSSGEAPAINNQGNFGTGYGYQYGPFEGTIEIKLDDGEWYVFATEKALASSEVKVTNPAEDTMLEK